MKSEILYGKRSIAVNVPEAAIVLDPKPAEPLADPEAAVLDALANPIGAPPLAQIARGRRDACIVISDITRPVPNRLILPPMLRTLEEVGIPRDKIVILISTGMHRPNLGDELERMVGPEVMQHYNIVNHSCRDDKDNVKVAEIDGAPIEINRRYLDADLKILTGLIEPHMYAGYSGGGKSILPGISSFTTMKHMHSFKMIAHPKVTNCVLEGNPLHEAGEQVCDLVDVDFILNVVINKRRKLVGLFAGDLHLAHKAGCDLVAEHAVHRLDEAMDLVVTSAGGYPLDATFYQVSKGLIMAKGLVKPSGAVIIAAECREGLGSREYCSLIREARKPGEFFDEFADPDKFVIDQWCLQTTYQALDHAREIYVYSESLSAEDLEGMGFTKIDDVQATIDRLLPDNPRVAVVPQGPYVVGLVREI